MYILCQNNGPLYLGSLRSKQTWNKGKPLDTLVGDNIMLVSEKHAGHACGSESSFLKLKRRDGNSVDICLLLRLCYLAAPHHLLRRF